MSDTWSLPGYDVVDLIGAGAAGEVWRGRDHDTGDTVALKRLRPGADPTGLTALRREATLLRTLDTPYVVRLRAVVGDVLVLDHAPGGSLSALLTRRGTLDPGEVVTIGGPLASGLASAHAVGLVHGDVSASNVLFTAEGMPLLADLGVARLAGESGGTVHGTADYVDPAVAVGGDPGPASDVWALAALCHQMLAGTTPHDGDCAGAVLDASAQGARAPLGLLAPHAPRALVSAVEAGLTRDPEHRPDAAAFASLLRRAHAASPVRLVGGPVTPAPVRETHVVRREPVGPHKPRHRKRRRALLARTLRLRALAGAALGLLVALAGLVGWWSGQGAPAAAGAPSLAAVSSPASQAPSGQAPSGQAPPGQAPSGQAGPVPPPPTDPDGAPDWPGVLTGLDAARAAAYEAGDPAALEAVWAPGSPGLRADTATLTALTERGQVVHGLRHTLRSVAVGPDGSTRLQVVDVLAGHEIRDRQGTVVHTVPPRTSASWEVSMQSTAAGWRMESVAAR